MRSSNINKVFYADSYYPIQVGSIDGTDVLPHDNAVYRALLCSAAGLYDPFGDPKVIGDPHCTVFVGRLSHFTNEETLRKAMSRYGRVKSLRLVRHIVTGASRGYAFVEYETGREMHHAYEEAHHTFIDDSEIIVDYNRQQLMHGWIPRRLGGGLGGKKESGQLRFGGRERPFRAPLRPIPYDDLQKLGIPPPPEGRYLTRFEVPSPPRRKGDVDGEDLPGRERKRADNRDDCSPGRRRKLVEREEESLRSSPRRKSGADGEDLPRRERRGAENRDEITPGGYRRKRGEASSPARERSDRDEGSPATTKWRSGSSHRDSHSHKHRRRHREHSQCHHHESRSSSGDYGPEAHLCG